MAINIHGIKNAFIGNNYCEVTYMAQRINKIKEIINGAVKQNYSVLYKQGRKKILLPSCTIEAAYPEIFVISHIDTKTKRCIKLSFSYTELLTKSVCLCPEKSLPANEVI